MNKPSSAPAAIGIGRLCPRRGPGPLIPPREPPPVRPSPLLTVTRRLPGRRPLAALLAGAMALASLAGLPEAAEAPIPFGENLVHSECLHFTVYAYRNRQSTVDPNDWVTLNLRNQCPVALRNLQVVLLLYDRNGNPFGVQIWLLGRGEILRPGRLLRERLAVPNPDNRVASGWWVKVLRVGRIVRPPPPRPKPQ